VVKAELDITISTADMVPVAGDSPVLLLFHDMAGRLITRSSDGGKGGVTPPRTHAEAVETKFSELKFTVFLHRVQPQSCKSNVLPNRPSFALRYKG
jgi:hypothetical protein